jgi:hypothetical protein
MKSKSAPEYDVRFNIAATRPLVLAVANGCVNQSLLDQ